MRSEKWIWLVLFAIQYQTHRIIYQCQNTYCSHWLAFGRLKIAANKPIKLLQADASSS